MRAITGTVRAASSADAEACRAVYRPYVEDTATSWELDVPTVAEMARRIDAAQEKHEWLVLEQDDRLVGFAYGHALIRLPTYQWSTETGIYLDARHHRCGGGRTLYTELLRRLAARGYRRAFAGITQPNEASTGFHRSFGFRDAGLYRRVEWKHGRWHDVAWLQLDLVGAEEIARPPTRIV